MDDVQRALPTASSRAVAVHCESALARPPQETFLPRKIKLKANYFDITLPHGIVYHYDVDISSKRDNRQRLSVPFNRVIIDELWKQKLHQLYNYPAVFDGRKNLYTREKLPCKEKEYMVRHQNNDHTQDFSVVIKFAKAVNLDELQNLYYTSSPRVHQDVIQALDIIIRHGPSLAHTLVGRSIFMSPKGGLHDFYSGYEVLFGYYTSVRPGEYEMMLNIDFSAALFYGSIPVLDFVKQFLRQKFNVNDIKSECPRLTVELKNVKVSVNHLRNTPKFRVLEVTRKSAEELTFLLNSSQKETTVAEYFETTYPGRLKNPKLPCLKCKTRSGSEIYLPLDVCHIEKEQQYRNKLDPFMTRKIIKLATKSPDQRFEFIKGSVQDVVNTGEQHLKTFDMGIGTDPVMVEGHILDPPSIVFARDLKQQPGEGAWKMKGQRFINTKSTKCAVLTLSCRIGANSVKEVTRWLQETAESLGMVLEIEPDSTICRHSALDIIADLRKLKEANVQLVVVVLGQPSFYAVVKAAAEVSVGVLTQCIKEENVRQLSSPVRKPSGTDIINNLCLKMNAKLGGSNNSLSSHVSEPIFADSIIIGVDVNHPAPGDDRSPSIAACVASMDQHASRYRAKIKVQLRNGAELATREEVVGELQAMVSELLQSYCAERGLPKRVIVYRDGVSDGQFDIVRERELTAIKAAVQAATADLHAPGMSEPAVTFIVVQKRHHTRFMRDTEGRERSANIPPGTVVDRVVTRPKEINFFLCSHGGRLGTSRPTHYHVVHDDAESSSNELQQLTYDLCHLVARCSRSVSTPAPVYYAHLAAFRAKHHIAGRFPTSHVRPLRAPSLQQYIDAVKVHENVANTMYFL
ncbi:protein argonaute-2-like isoform X2 [Dermacentor albipictus]